MVSLQPQPHCQLRVHQLTDVEAAAGGVLKAAAEKHKQQQQQQQQGHQHKSHSTSSGATSRQAGAGRHLGSRPTGASSSWSGWTGVQ
jgi:hypothetical protein